MRRGFVAGAVAVLAAFVGSGSASAAILTSSTFNANVDGWTVQGDSVTVDPSWVSTGGNPGGYATITDSAAGGVMFWLAPAKFEGNKSAAYSGRLRFDLRQAPITVPFDDSDVVIEGGGLTLVYDTASNPGTVFTRYSVPLLPAGWHKGTAAGVQPTVAELKTALGAITSLEIRAEYNNGQDTDDIDSVFLMAPPQTTITSGPANNSTTADPTPTFTFISSEPTAATFQCRITPGATPSGAFSACNTGSFTAAALADGQYTFQARARGGSGVDPTPATRRFTVNAP